MYYYSIGFGEQMQMNITFYKVLGEKKMKTKKRGGKNKNENEKKY
jgi:phosphotransferase system  glucose/maltose/N-acetylglucosamine-specific IIC component